LYRQHLEKSYAIFDDTVNAILQHRNAPVNFQLANAGIRQEPGPPSPTGTSPCAPTGLEGWAAAPRRCD
jgi:hypothetical protein